MTALRDGEVRLHNRLAVLRAERGLSRAGLAQALAIEAVFSREPLPPKSWELCPAPRTPSGDDDAPA